MPEINGYDAACAIALLSLVAAAWHEVITYYRKAQS